MFSKFLSFAFIFLLTLIFISCSDNSTNPVEHGSGVDYLIYKNVLLNQFPEQNILIVLTDSTYTEDMNARNLEYYQSHIPDLSYKTFTDYISRNQTRIKLKNIPDIKNLVFRSEFKIKVPDTVSVTFSRIGYNAEKTQAILFMSEVYAPLAGTGNLVFLKKENNTWIVAQVLMIWIS